MLSSVGMSEDLHMNGHLSHSILHPRAWQDRDGSQTKHRPRPHIPLLLLLVQFPIDNHSMDLFPPLYQFLNNIHQEELKCGTLASFMLVSWSGSDRQSCYEGVTNKLCTGQTASITAVISQIYRSSEGTKTAFLKIFQ